MPDDNVTVGGFSVAEGPLGVTVAVRLTLPEKPLRLVRVTVKFPEDPSTMPKVVGLEAMLKLVTSTEYEVAAWGIPPMAVPVTKME